MPKKELFKKNFKPTKINTYKVYNKNSYKKVPWYEQIRWFRILVFITFIIAIPISVYSVSKIIQNPEENKINMLNSNNDTQSSINEIKTVPPDSLKLKLLFTGDVFWGRSVDDWSKNSDLGAKYPFSMLDTFNRDEYNGWIGNLECPVTTTYRTALEQEKNLKFSCLPEYLPEAHKYFDVMSLANNHTDNMEEVDGFNQTKDLLEKEGIQYFGHYDNAETDDLCEVVTFKATAIWNNNLDSENEEKLDLSYNLPIALCGYHGVFKLPLQKEIDVISKYSDQFITFAIPHQGAEYIDTPGGYKKETFKKMIDAGADAVIGHHPHVVQSTEVYKNKLIAYSLGNFIFDQQSSNTTIGAVLDTEITIPYTENIGKYVKLSDNCKIQKDSCNNDVKTQKLQKPQFDIKYDMIGSDSSNKITKKADKNIQKIVETRSNWSQTVKNLGQ